MSQVAKLVIPAGMDPKQIGVMDANRFVTTADIALKLEVIASPADPAKPYTPKSYTAKSCTNELVHDAMKV